MILDEPNPKDKPITIDDILKSHNREQMTEASVEFGTFLRRYYRTLTGADAGVPGIPPVYAATMVAQYQATVLATQSGTEPPVVVMPVSADGIEFLVEDIADLEGGDGDE